MAWARETGDNKERIVAQFKEPVTKNRRLTAYEATRSDGYDSDFTANTQNSEGTFVFHALQAETEFDTSGSLNSNGELEGIAPCEPSGLIVNAAISKSILRNKNKQKPKRTIPQSSEMNSGAPAKLLANKRLRLVDTDGKTYGHMTFRATMAVLNYVRCDTLIPELIPSPDIHYKVNLAQTVVGGVILAL